MENRMENAQTRCLFSPFMGEDGKNHITKKKKRNERKKNKQANERNELLHGGTAIIYRSHVIRHTHNMTNGLTETNKKRRLLNDMAFKWRNWNDKKSVSVTRKSNDRFLISFS